MFTMCLAQGLYSEQTDVIPAGEADDGDNSYHLSTSHHVPVYFGSLSMNYNSFRWGLYLHSLDEKMGAQRG